MRLRVLDSLDRFFISSVSFLRALDVSDDWLGLDLTEDLPEFASALSWGWVATGSRASLLSWEKKPRLGKGESSLPTVPTVSMF